MSLEQIVSDALVFDDETFTHAPLGELHFSAFEQQSRDASPELPLAVYQLLSGAHYRTSPLDLRRMMDAHGQHFLQASTADSVAGAVWLVDEGDYPQIKRAVWAGYRRPRGIWLRSRWRRTVVTRWRRRSSGGESVELRFILRAKEKVLGNS